MVEAMAAGDAVIVSDLPGMGEVVEGAGLVVPPGDPVALAAAITRMLDDDDLRTRLASAGRARVADLSMDKVGAAYTALLHETAAVRPPAIATW
jgi:glycosyltransferase involved in cell wall biosynthesis